MTAKNKYIRAGWLIDGTGGKALKDCIIKLSGERISSVENIAVHNDLPLEYLDLTGCTIIPGLVDSHTHLAISGALDIKTRNTQITDEYRYAEIRVKKHIADYLKYGVVAVRDGGDFHAHVLRYKNEIQDSNDAPLTIYASGNGYHAKGRYGQLLGMYLEPGRDLAQAILEDYKPGIDHIKIVNSGVNSLAEYGRETAPQFTEEDLEKAVKAAESIGLKIMVHANGRVPVRGAVKAGCHTIEHGYFMGEDNLRMMADSGVTWVPTVVPMKAYMDTSEPESEGHNIAEKNILHQLRQIEKALEYGVTIALGTDAGSPGVYHGASIIDEFGLLVKAGFSVEQAVKCATSNAMMIFGDDSNKGTIFEGQPANFAVVKGSPCDLPGSLKNIHQVWVRGQRI